MLFKIINEMRSKLTKVLITAPSFANLSGISTLVESIMNRSGERHRYFHFELGKLDNTKKGFRWLFVQIFLVPKLVWKILSNNIDLVHLNVPFYKPAILRDFTICLISNVVLRRKLLMHMHGGPLLLNPPQPGSLFGILIKKMLAMADKVIVLSQIEHDAIFKSYKVESLILPNAIEHVASYPESKTFDGKLILLFLGRIVVSKGVFLLADVLRSLENYYSHFEFHIYGTGPAMETLLVRLSNIKGLNYQYLGVALDKKKQDVFDKAHIFLLPSLYGEGLPLALLEAMAGGCVPLVSNNASMPEVITHNRNGFMVEMGNAEDLRKKIIELLENRKVLPGMSRLAYDTVLNKYTFDRYLAQLHSAYDDL